MAKTKIDYKRLGLKAGLEIHQELDLSTKLFCRCPPILQKEDPDYLLKRFFRPVMGELGQFDKAMLTEYEKNHTVIYEGNFDSNCTYDIDETPPFSINQEAIDVGITIVQMLNGTLIDELHVCRKNYLDGSVPSGFQRTLIIGINGKLPLENKKIGINTISIEEDAARKVKIEDNNVYYKLDRLGIPLIELVTDPVLESPNEIVEAAYRIGLLLRSTGKTKRGLGTVRQDVNLSIKGGSRVELKGVQKLDWFEKLVDNEIERQLNLLKITDALGNKGVSEEKLGDEPQVLDDIFSTTECNLIKNNLKKRNTVLGINLHGFKGLLGRKMQSDKSFGYEIAQRVMILTGLKGLIHSDEDLSKYKISEKELSKVISKLNCQKDDAFAIVVGTKEKTLKAISVIIERCKKSLNGVPLETRRVNEDGTSQFERDLHGGARLYPDTDTPTIQVTNARILEIKSNLPPFIWDIEKKYSNKYSIPEKTIRSLILEDKINLFLKIVDELKIDPVLVSTTLIETFKAIQRENLNVEAIAEDKVYDMFIALEKGRIAKEAIEDVIRSYAKDSDLSLDDIIKDLGLKRLSKEELSKIIDEMLKNNLEMIKEKKDRVFAPLMGDLMKKVRGKIDGKIVSDTLKEKLIELVKKNE
jgi:glutamyl-tRNA(Gln) amidotransferase subunit E